MDVLIWGLGRSGWGALLLALKKGYRVAVSEQQPLNTQTRQFLQQHDIPYEEGKHTPQWFAQAPLIVKSPGIPPHHPLFHEIPSLSQRVISDIEWGYLHTQNTIIAITGTNGKSTTTKLIAHLLQTANLPAAFSGNIGKSFCLQIIEWDAPYHVVEVSSFQLAHTQKFHPKIAIILNIAPDHLDWHKTMNHYITAKWKITQNQTPNDWLLTGSDTLTQTYLQNQTTRAQHLPIHYTFNPKTLEVSIPLPNHTTLTLTRNDWIRALTPQNVAAATLTAYLMNIPPKTIQHNLSTFQGLPHRMETIAEYQQVLFINDSKATNVHATHWALTLANPPIIWIMGGYLKGKPDWTPLIDLAKQKVKAIICIAKDWEPFYRAFHHLNIPFHTADTFTEAIHQAWQYAEPGATILFSPAAASYDRFQNYQERGEHFCQTVWNFVEHQIYQKSTA